MNSIWLRNLAAIGSWLLNMTLILACLWIIVLRADEVSADLWAQGIVGYTVPTGDELRSDNAYAIRVGYGPVYGAVRFTEWSTRLGGLDLGETDLPSFAVGVQGAHKRLYGFLEASYTRPSMGTAPGFTEREAAIRALWRINGTDSPPFTDAEYGLEPAFGVAAGFGANVWRELSVELRYEWLQLPETIVAWAGDDPRPSGQSISCGCLWISAGTRNFGSATLSAAWRF